MQPKKIGVHIKCRNIQRSLQFYVTLGFVPVFVYGNDEFRKQFICTTVPEKYNGVSMAIGDSILEIADGHIAVKPEVFQQTMPSSKISLFFDVESVDNVVKTCTQYGIAVAVPVKEYPWGTREIVIKDPDGVVLVFREFISKEYKDSLIA